MTSNQVFQNCQLEKSHLINHIVTTEYSILAYNQHFIFMFHYFNAKLLGKYSESPVWQLCDNCQILDLINFQNNLTWHSNTAGISPDPRLKYCKITHRYAKNSPSLGSCTDNFPLIQIVSILSVNFTSPVAWMSESVFWADCTSARHAGSFDCLMTSLILITMDNGRGHCTWWQCCKVPNQTHREIKQI